MAEDRTTVGAARVSHQHTVIIGAQFGDEAKGKHVEWRSNDPQVGAAVRFNGGSNAGHTIVKGTETYKLRLTPSGIFNDCYGVVASGVMVNPAVLNKELDELTARGVSVERLKISKHAGVVTPYDIAMDIAEESVREQPIGTTKNGNGPAYANKYSRAGLRMIDLTDPVALKSKLEFMVRRDTPLLKEAGADIPELEPVLAEFARYGAQLQPYLVDTGKLLETVAAAGQALIFEGAQGAFLDIDNGTHPFVTSSHTVADAAGLGGYGLPNKEVIGVAKAYITRVGGEPLPTELEGDLAAHIQDKGAEFGTVTQRRRRCGWFDLVMLRAAKRINGMAKVDITKLDVLSDIPGGVLKVAVAYEHVDSGERLTDTLPDDFDQYRPVYEELPGFSGDFTGCTTWEELPPEARDYVAYISKQSGLPVDLVGVGPATIRPSASERS